MAAIPVFLDTDIGTSLDDTVCLAYLANSPGFDIVGVSTVTDKSSIRGDYARSILRHYGVEAPIVAGAERSLAGQTMQPKLAPDLPTAPRASFAEVYADALAHYGEELVVLSIGPFTNLSAAGLGVSGSGSSEPRSEPRFRSGPLPRLVSMATSIAGEAEWNVLLDPEAAADILSTLPDSPQAFRERTVVPIETTRRLTMTSEEAMDRLPRHLTAPFGDLSHHPRHPGTVVLHDPLAALILLEPGHCSYRVGSIEFSHGSTRFRQAGEQEPGEPDARRDHLVVAVDVERDAALDAILSGLA